ncbi:outer-membrane lipoprotein carrier protein LolA [Hyphomonas sp.]|jgi:outer membrane lipoprotein-sorting protein|uniref:LolA family protein n=1 Tax=Hyphomonas sp. TaxID=87 RepID=UPI0025BCAA52|nr:outer-membrane lipoprotein carrier protein LolA [Hyphomonas sp.]MBI1399799.1 outer membrane lipoprotein carrier protein LolA [Hyphomonas sp.]
MMNLIASASAIALILGAPLTVGLKQVQPKPAVTAEAQTTAPMTAAERTRLLKEASKALANVKTARGKFEQYSPDGSLSTGQFAMSRPGKVRFDYDDPTPLLLVSDGTTVALQDSELETTDRVPLSQTPLSLLLSDKLDFEKQAEVIDVRRTADRTNITVRDKSGETDGTLTVILDNKDNALTGWRTVDASGGRTSVLLSGVEVGAKLNPRLFILRDFDNR